MANDLSINNLTLVKRIVTTCITYSSAYKLNPLNCVYSLIMGTLYTELSVYSLRQQPKLNAEYNLVPSICDPLDFKIKTANLLELNSKDSTDFVLSILPTSSERISSHDAFLKASVFVNNVLTSGSDQVYTQNKYGCFAVFSTDVGASSVRLFYYPTMSALEVENLIY